MRACKTCGDEKELTEYHIQRKNKDGYNLHCRTCVSERKQKEGYWKKYHASKNEDDTANSYFIDWTGWKL